MNGQKERLMVLDMIAEGKITAEEAEQLFKAMEVVEDESASDTPDLVPPLSHLAHLTSLPGSSPGEGRSSARDLIAALKEANIDQVTLSDVQELQSQRLTAEYVREMLGLGLEPDGLSEWIDLRAHNITPRYVRELRDLGVTDLDVDELLELRNHGVSAKYVSSLREMGVRDFDVDELIQLNDHDVSAKYIAELRAAGLQELDVDELIRLSDHGISAKYLAELRQAGLKNLAVDELIELSQQLRQQKRVMRREAPAEGFGQHVGLPS